MKLFKLIKEIKSKEGFLHFRRWRILETKWLSIYFHGLYKSDDDIHCHNHPWSFWSLVLWGRYTEKIDDPQKHDPEYKIRGIFNLTYHNKNLFHKLHFVMSPTYTLVITGPKRHNWGYLVNKKYINYDYYRYYKNNDPDKLVNL